MTKKIKLERGHKIARCTLSRGAKYALHTLQERPGSHLSIKLLGDSRYYYLNSTMSDAQHPIEGRYVRELELAGWVTITANGVRAKLVT